ncbi:MAG: restriction endonuclease [Candidatus Sulfotelmatobacter sp.]
MTGAPLAYEEMVADYFRRQGYSVELTPRSNDYGVDAFASKEKQKLALQAKMYGNARKVNRAMVMQLHGAKDYFDCNEAVIVTDGDVTEDARKVAAKLQIKILFVPVERLSPCGLVSTNATPSSGEVRRDAPTFSEVWERHVMPLTGRTLVGPDGRTNTLLNVDWSGVKRRTSRAVQFIPIEVFRQAVGRLIERGQVTRKEINEDYVGRASSGVVLILSQVPFFEHLTSPSRLVLRRASQAPESPTLD